MPPGISICLPSGLHKEAVLAALGAGKHVICEKPFDITLDAIDEMLAAERESAGKVTVIFQNRFHPSVQLVKEAAQTGQFGRLTFASAEIPWFRAQAYYDSGDWRGTWA